MSPGPGGLQSWFSLGALGFPEASHTSPVTRGSSQLSQCRAIGFPSRGNLWQGKITPDHLSPNTCVVLENPHPQTHGNAASSRLHSLVGESTGDFPTEPLRLELHASLHAPHFQETRVGLSGFPEGNLRLSEMRVGTHGCCPTAQR